VDTDLDLNPSLSVRKYLSARPSRSSGPTTPRFNAGFRRGYKEAVNPGLPPMQEGIHDGRPGN